MAKVWVLETHTKGTGANLVPLERTLKKPAGDPTPQFVVPELKPRPPQAPEPPKPRVFNVVDVMTRRVLCEDADGRATVTALENVRSVVDVTVSVWASRSERWRILTFDEIQALWSYRGRLQDLPLSGSE